MMISAYENASKHFNKMRSKHNEDICLGIGVKQGGYSGMSYTMDFYSKENARPDDSTIEYNGFKIAGLCTLTLAYKKLEEPEYSAWNNEFQRAKSSIGADREVMLERVAENMEKDLIMVGATAVEDKLQKRAVMASDFAIAQFRFLERLLVIHGHWCYKRIAQMICYFFYKNIAFGLVHTTLRYSLDIRG